MNITLETIEAALAVVIFLAVAVERGVEIFKPLLNKITNAEWLVTIKIVIAITLGILVAALLRLDFLAVLGIGMFSPWAGYAAAGVLASAGASPWHALLEWLKTLDSKEVTTTTTTTGEVVEEVVVVKA